MIGISVDDVTVTLGNARVIDGVTVTVAAGEWLALIGPNGAGKSTLLRTVAGGVEHTGEVTLAGEPTAGLSPRERARRVAVVPQRPTVPIGLTVTDYVLLGRTPWVSWFGSESSSDLDAVARLLEQLDLVRLADRHLTDLSGGEFQRAVLARALAQQAPIMLLDEPTSALDIGHAQQVLELVDQLRHEHDLTVVTAMHDLTTVAQYADRLVLLAAGRAVAAGTPAEVLTTATVTEYYGADVRVVPLDDGGVLVAPVRRTRRPAEGIMAPAVAAPPPQGRP